MTGHGTTEARLDRVVTVIADYMAAEVCSIYVLRDQRDLELFATKGLNRDAVHLTRLKKGEGLVGLIAEQARPVALADAQSHPNFVLRPETGEEVYHSFMGVPVLRAGRVLGVMVVQNLTRRRYAEAEIEACETVAMVLAEVLAAAGEREPAAAAVASGPALIAGISLSRGVATGRARRVQREIVVEHTLADQPEPELKRLDEAFAALSTGLEAHIEGSALPAMGEHREVLEAFKMFAEDHGWRERIADACVAASAPRRPCNWSRTRSAAASPRPRTPICASAWSISTISATACSGTSSGPLATAPWCCRNRPC